MPNVNFAGSVLPRTLLKLGTVFSGGDARYAQYNNKKSSAIKTIVERQTARTNELFNGNKCVGVDVTFYKDCTPLGAYACAAPPTTGGCELVATETGATQTVTYHPNCYHSESFALNDDLCSNEFLAEDVLMKKMANAIDRLDVKMNRYAIAQIAANATTNLYPATVGTVVGTRTDIPAALWTPDLLVQIEQDIEFAGINNFVILDAYNLLTQRQLAMYRNVNDHNRDEERIFGNYDSRIVFENATDITTVLSRRSTLVWDLDSVALVNRSFFPSGTPVLVDASKNIYEFHVISPRTGLKYDVEYQKTCQDTRDANGQRVYNHVFVVKFLGGIVFAPSQCDGSNGVLEFTYV